MTTECCCGREIEKIDGKWDHVDGTGTQCWPNANVGSADFTYHAEPVIDPDGDDYW